MSRAWREPHDRDVLLTNRGDPEAVIAGLRPFRGSVYQTTLAPDLDEEVRHALK